MHDDEVAATLAQVRDLLDDQFPRWADRPLRPVAAFGTDHVLFRLGADLVVRMPRIASAEAQIDTDGCWLPVLAGSLPVRVPEQVAVGQAGHGYPWRWSVVRWIDGVAPEPGSVAAEPVARELGAFVAALRAAPAAGAPVRTDRGAPLSLRDELVRDDLAALGERVDAAAVRAVWADALAAPVWEGPPVWLHGDLKAGNLLVDGDRLVGVIDWGGVGVGDPAVDLTPAWLSLTPGTRTAFREAAGLDDDAWRRGRGWALTISLRELPYYWDRSPVLAHGARRGIAAVVEEFEAH